MRKKIYLDYNAGAPLHPAAKEAVMKGLDEEWGNALSLHQWGQKAQREIEKVRRSMADILKCHPDHIIFTGGGSEANNHALRGVEWDQVFISSLEHDSVYKACIDAVLIPVDHKGYLNLDLLEEKLKDQVGKKTLVSAILACGETGVIQPLEPLAALVKKYGAFLHVDATQFFAKMPLPDLAAVDMLTLSGHKFGSLEGVGILMVREKVPLMALLRGGGQEKNRRAGTHNVLGIKSLGAMLEQLPDLSPLRPYHEKLEQQMKEHSQGQAQVIGEKGDRVPNVTCVATPSLSREKQLIHFDLQGIGVSGGAACSSGKIGPSRVVHALCKDASLAQCSIRISSGWNTNPSDFDAFFKVWKNLYDQKPANKERNGHDTKR